MFDSARDGTRLESSMIEGEPILIDGEAAWEFFLGHAPRAYLGHAWDALRAHAESLPIAERLQTLRRRPALLTDWERRFVASLSSRPEGEWTPRQHACAERIVADRLVGSGAP